jgi:hypothetical protein
MTVSDSRGGSGVGTTGVHVFGSSESPGWTGVSAAIGCTRLALLSSSTEPASEDAVTTVGGDAFGIGMRAAVTTVVASSTGYGRRANDLLAPDRLLSTIRVGAVETAHG